MMNHKNKLSELERRAGAGKTVIGVMWQDKPDEIKVGDEVLTWEQWGNKYPDAQNVTLKWGDE